MVDHDCFHYFWMWYAKPVLSVVVDSSLDELFAIVGSIGEPCVMIIQFLESTQQDFSSRLWNANGYIHIGIDIFVCVCVIKSVARLEQVTKRVL